MQCRAIPVCVLLAVGIAVQVSPAQDKPKSSQKNTKGASMTGCVDQQEGRYVLVDDHGLKKIADLQADGFPPEGFAKHVGHKVVVRGASSGGDSPQFKVRAIETVSEICAPANNQQERH